MNPDYDVIIVGAGFSGVGLALKLKRAGLDNFVILESEAGVGGTWWVNRYPGCACDVQSHLYSLSFAPNPNWSRHFPPREEIQSHLEQVVKQGNLLTHIHFNTKVETATWNEDANLWTVTDQSGQERTGRVFISAMGGLSKPKWPEIEGLNDFSGAVFHSQQWPEDIDLTKRKVGVIGTGASAVQFIPHVAKQASRLTVFQRTPNWILPKPDRSISSVHRWFYQNIPPIRWLLRLALFLLLETRLPAFTRFPKLAYFHRKKAIKHLQSQVQDPALWDALTPAYPMGCKRVLMSNDFYPSFNRPNVSLITQSIKCITPTGIIDESGTAHEFDALILGTGFEASHPIPPGLILGRNHTDLAEAWSAGPEAYKGLSVHGFPNMFLMLGPNTALGHNSVLLMIEGQINYVVDAINTLKKNAWQSVEVLSDSQASWNNQLAKTLKRSVWNAGGCQSWYLHPTSGRNTTLWPHTTIRYKHLTKRFDASDYSCK